MNRLVLMKAHAVLAAFILPVTLMYFITGAFYTWGIKGSYDTVTHELTLERPLQNDLAALVALATKELERKNISVPSGQAGIKTMGSSYRLEWVGADRDIILEPTSQPLIAKLQIKNTSWYRQFVQLHKAKGGTPFKVYAVVFATVLFLLLTSGFIMAWQTPKLRKLALASTVIGIVTFVIMILSS